MKTIEELLQDKQILATKIYTLLSEFKDTYGVLPTVTVEAYKAPTSSLADTVDLIDVKIEVTL